MSTSTATTPNNNNNNTNDTFQSLLKQHSDWTLMSQGAEARLHFIPHYLPNSQAAVCKERFSKSYRHAILDKRLTKQRIKAEVRCITKCRRAGIACPAIYGVEPPLIFMEFLKDSMTVRNYIATHESTVFSDLAVKMGSLIAKVHNAGVIHGDLTTSNIMITADVDLTLIDFGLARVSTNPEEMAVDLYVLERAMTSTHPNLPNDFLQEIWTTYKATCTKSHAVLLRLSQVRMRGRKRECFG